MAIMSGALTLICSTFLVPLSHLSHISAICLVIWDLSGHSAGVQVLTAVVMTQCIFWCHDAGGSDDYRGV